MGSVKRVAVTAALAVFVGALVLRPLLSNPAVSAAVSDGSLSWSTLLAVPLLLVTLLLVAARVRSLGSDSGSTARDDDHRNEDRRDGTASPEMQLSAGWKGDDVTGSDHPAADEGSQDGDQNRAETGQPGFLSGQGGTRDKDFEIEDDPPEAALSDHLAHLQTELDDDAAEDLETMAEVVEAVETETVPERCPQPHCEAAWTERTVFGVANRRYELLDEGDRVQCLECERVVDLE